MFFVHAGRALRLALDTFRHLFSFTKGADKPIFPARIRMLSVVFVERKAVDFKDKNAGCAGGIIKKRLPLLKRLSGNSAAFLSATAACISRVQAAADASLSGRTAQIAQLHSAESSVNSGEKPAGFYEELTQRTEPKFVKTSSVFFETDDIFRAGFAITHL